MKNKFYKVLSVLLTLAVVFSVCVCAIGSVSAAQTITYYVKNSGSDSANGLTVSTAFKTVSKAIEAADNAGLKEGDTLNLMVCEYPAISWGTENEYDFDVKIKSNDPNLRSGIIIPNGFMFPGNVSFEYMRMEGSIDRIYYNNKNVSIAKDCAFAINNHYTGNNSGDTVNKAHSVTLRQAVMAKNIVIGDYNKGKTYNKSVTLNIAHESSTPAIKIGSESSTTTFKEHLNINIMNSASVTFAKNSGAVVVEGAIQAVINGKTKITGENKAALSNLNPAEGVYYIVNATNVDDIIGFTETAGTYIVDTNRYSVKAKDAEENEYVAEDGILVLPKAGEYSLTVKKEIENPIYYVSATGDKNNDGLTKDTPLVAINEVIRKANEAGYWEGDTVTVNVIDTVDWSSEFKINSTTETIVDKYSYLLYVQSDNLASLSTVKFVHRQRMTGNVEFQNIKLNYGSRDGATPIWANNYDITYGDNAIITNSKYNFAFGNYNEQLNPHNGQHIVIKNAFVNNISLGNEGHHNGRVFDEDVSLVLDNPKIKTLLYTGCYHGGTTTMKKNLNIDIKEAKSVQFRPGSRITPETVSRIAVQGALQVIVNKDIILDGESKATLTDCAVGGKLYILNNASGIKDLLEFTETAGKYKLALGSERCKVMAIDEDGNVYESANGYLALPKSGEYLIDAKVTNATTEYYVSANGVDTNNGKTADTPVATVEKAVKLAQAAGFVAGDTVVIKFVGSDYTFGSVPAHTFDIKYTSATSSKTNITVAAGMTIAYENNGTTTFDNVQLNVSNQYTNIFLKVANVHFTSNCKFSFGYGTGIGLLSSNNGGAASKPNGQKVVLECALPYAIYLSNTGWANVARQGDVELVLDSASSDTRISFNASNAGAVNGSTKYKNINLNIKALKSVAFNSTGNVTVEGAIQIIDSKGLEITAQTAGLADIVCDKYIIKNNTGNKDILSFTETAGKFAVDSDWYIVEATDGNNNKYTSENGFLSLPVTGEYTLSLTHTHYYANNCDARCNSCNHRRENTHVYDNDCDKYCNECTNMREIYHTYDNDCDKLCNVCYEYRVTEHVFTNDIDIDCDSCGAIRTIKGGMLFTEADGTVYYYYDGAKSSSTGLKDYQGKLIYINKGKFTGASGLVTIDGKKMYIDKGYFTGSSGLVTVSGKKMYINKGYFTGASGLVTINGKKHYINKGYFTGSSGLVTISGKKAYINKGYFTGSSGLVTVSGKKMYINKGYFTGATGIVTISGKKYYINKGYWTASTGIVKIGSKRYYINKGYFTGASGKVKVGGKTYTVVKGIVK